MLFIVKTFFGEAFKYGSTVVFCMLFTTFVYSSEVAKDAEDKENVLIPSLASVCSLSFASGFLKARQNGEDRLIYSPEEQEFHLTINDCTLTSNQLEFDKMGDILVAKEIYFQFVSTAGVINILTIQPLEAFDPKHSYAPLYLRDITVPVEFKSNPADLEHLLSVCPFLTCLY